MNYIAKNPLRSFRAIAVATASLCLLSGMCTPTFASLIDSCVSCIEAKQVGVAAPVCEEAFSENPSDPRAQYYYAKTCSDGALACSLYHSAAQAVLLPDTIRADALVAIGDAAFVRREYARAAREFGASLRMVPSLYALRMMLKSIAAQRSSVKGASHTRGIGIDSVLCDTTFACSTGIVRALVYLADKNYDSAAVILKRSCIDSTSAAGVSAAYMCAAKLHDTAWAATLEKKLKKWYPSLLEKKLLTGYPVSPKGDSGALVSKGRIDTVPIAAKKDPVPTVSPKKDATPPLGAVHAPPLSYCIQLAAFGSSENAAAFKTKYSAKIPALEILAQTDPAGTTLYKVIIKGFDSRDSAAIFGRKKLDPIGVTGYRVFQQVR